MCVCSRGGGDMSTTDYLNTELPEHWTHVRWQGQASGEVLGQWCQILGLYITGHRGLQEARNQRSRRNQAKGGKSGLGEGLLRAASKI